MGRQGHDTSAAAPGMRIQRSQSKMSLSASFEALAVYFPCMNSFDEEDGGKTISREMSQQQQLAGGAGGGAWMDLGLAGRYTGIDCRENWGRLKDVISLIRMTV